MGGGYCTSYLPTITMITLTGTTGTLNEVCNYISTKRAWTAWGGYWTFVFKFNKVTSSSIFFFFSFLEWKYERNWRFWYSLIVMQLLSGRVWERRIKGRRRWGSRGGRKRYQQQERHSDKGCWGVGGWWWYRNRERRDGAIGTREVYSA